MNMEQRAQALNRGMKCLPMCFLKTNQENERAASDRHTETIITNQVKVPR